MSDLFGSDLPVPDDDSAGQSVEGPDQGTGARFAWCDGVFLSALKSGKWVLLDELNLATQVREVRMVCCFTPATKRPGSYAIFQEMYQRASFGCGGFAFRGSIKGDLVSLFRS